MLHDSVLENMITYSILKQNLKLILLRLMVYVVEQFDSKATSPQNRVVFEILRP